jgi:hypothetical protein
MWRQGDVLIDRVEQVPSGATKLKRLILASGDSTGQRHTIWERKAADLYRRGPDELFLHVTAESATVVHPEHRPITLPRGSYRVWKQREFSDAAPRPVRD